MCEVVNSTLWKSLREGLSKYERAKLLRELRKVMAHDARAVSLDVPDLLSAFVWAESPQGVSFWYDQYKAYWKRATAVAE